MVDFIGENEASRCGEFNDGEKGPRFFSDIPASQLGRYFTGITAETTAAIFPLKRRQRRFFSGSTPLTLLFFRFNAVNSAIFPVINGFCG